MIKGWGVMSHLPRLKSELAEANYDNYHDITNYYRYLGYREHYESDPLEAKAHSIATLFTKHEKHVYENDLMAGSIRGCFFQTHTDYEREHAKTIVNSYGQNGFWTNVYHEMHTSFLYKR